METRLAHFGFCLFLTRRFELDIFWTFNKMGKEKSKRKRGEEKTRVHKVSGCALCEKKENSHWYKNTDTGETDICQTCYNKRAPPNGCALCEKKESSIWHKNTDTGERDICDRCYRKHRRAIRMAPPNGCVISLWHWSTNTETGEIDICNTCYRQ